MQLKCIAQQALDKLITAGFQQAQVLLEQDEMDELSINHNHASLMRSTQKVSLRLTGIIDQRKTSVSLTSLTDETVDNAIADLLADAQQAPQDMAHQVSSDQYLTVVKGPQQADLPAITEAAKQLMAFRAEQTPFMHLEEAAILFNLSDVVLLTSGGSDLQATVGHYEVNMMGSAKDGSNTSSFNYTGGSAEQLPAELPEHFGIAELMCDTSEQMVSAPLNEKFTGEVLLHPAAVEDLFDWLLDQIGDYALLSDTSLYRDKVGQQIAAPLLSIRSRVTAAGEVLFTDDGFVKSDFELLSRGVLNHLLPSYYGSNKMNLPYRPYADNWTIGPGATSKADMLKSMERGAVVGRLSMGEPAPNGDFSGVIKNSFLIEKGQRKTALSEVMITGNVAEMLQDIKAISSETVDFYGSELPWIQITGLKFS